MLYSLDTLIVIRNKLKLNGLTSTCLSQLFTGCLHLRNSEGKVLHDCHVILHSTKYYGNEI
jgi:hypothetical protein